MNIKQQYQTTHLRMVYTFYTTYKNGDDWGMVHGIALPTLVYIK